MRMHLRTIAAGLCAALVGLAACSEESGPDELDAVGSSLTASGLSAVLTYSSDWGAGYCADLVLKNVGSTTITTWEVQTELAGATVTSSWSATFSTSGTRLIAKPLGWNGTLPPGGTTTVGFCATAPSASARPSVAAVSANGTGGGTGGAGTGGVATGGVATGGAGTGGASGGACTVTYEAETMTHSTGAAIAGGWNIYANGTVTASHSFSAGANRITVVAKGDQANGAPRMRVSVGGQSLGEVDVPVTTWTSYPFNYSATSAGTRTIEVRFLNDYYAAGADRNLHVDKVTATCGSGGSGGSGGTGGSTGGSGGGSTGGTGGSGGGAGGTTSYKPRVINTTDLGADPDDEQSMVRQLVLANEFDLEGLIVATGCFKKSQNSTAMLDRIVNAYGQVLPNLAVHASGYPSLAYLRSISALGNTGYGMGGVGAGKDSAGSELIIAAVDRNDPRPVWVTCWGGCNNIAQALWKVQNTRSPAALALFLSKVRVFDVLGQDDTGAWMAKTFPSLFYIRATGVYGWQPTDSWVDANVQSHGALGAAYPDRAWALEGDSPSFLHLVPNGLHDPEKVDQGGWGGRFDTTEKAGIRGMSPVTNESQYDTYTMYGNTSEGAAAITRWRPAYDNDFQARMDWTITSAYSGANHHPIAVVNGDTGRSVLEVTVAPGATVPLSAAGSRDPDNNGLFYSWWYYDEPSSYNGAVTIRDASSATPTVVVPANGAGKDLHVILELRDSGSPNLYAYRRVILKVR